MMKAHCYPAKKKDLSGSGNLANIDRNRKQIQTNKKQKPRKTPLNREILNIQKKNPAKSDQKA